MQIASVHPIKTFSKPRKAVASFRGTYCGVEGDKGATQLLEMLFCEIGGIVFKVNTEKKGLYHAALVFICNYLFTIVEAGLICYEEAGVNRQLAVKAIEPILRETIENALAIGPVKALTGPIARGDYLVVQKQVETLAEFEPSWADLYVALGKKTVDLAKEKGVANEADLKRIARILNGAAASAG